MPFEFPNSPANGEYANGFIWNAANQTWDSAIAPRAATVPISSPNYIINGGFDIWQRGTSFSSATLFQYSSDRWFANSFATSVATVTRQSFTPGECPGGNETEFFLRFARTGTTPSGTSYLQHRIEDVRKGAGKTVTLSFYARAVTAGTINVNYNQNFGSGGSSTVYGAGQNFAVTTAWTRFQVSWTLPAISGKTVGSSSYLELLFSIPQAFGLNTLDIWGVQLEDGAAATDFRRNAPSIAGELAACQRYYVRWSGSSATASDPGIGAWTTSTVAQITFFMPVEMRVKPTSIERGGTTYLTRPGISGYVISDAVLSRSDSKTQLVIATSASSGASAGTVAQLELSNSDSSYIALNAEL